MEIKKLSKDEKIEQLILQQLYTSPGHQAILLPSMFSPPIMLSNIFRIAQILKDKEFTTGPERRLGGWHLRLLPAGIAACSAGPSLR